jgi:hypothetical protein
VVCLSVIVMPGPPGTDTSWGKKFVNNTHANNNNNNNNNESRPCTCSQTLPDDTSVKVNGLRLITKKQVVC